MNSKWSNALKTTASRSSLRTKVTCNGPFVEFPTLTVKPEGQVLIEMPQSANVEVTNQTISCVRGNLSGLTNRVQISERGVYNRLHLSLVTSIIADGFASGSARISIIQATPTRKWHINGTESLVSWTRLALESKNRSKWATTEGDGEIALRSQISEVELSEGQQMYILTQRLLATNAHIAYDESCRIETKFLRNSSVALALRRGVGALVAYVSKKATGNTEVTTLAQTKERHSSDQLIISGPGTVILRDL